MTPRPASAGAPALTAFVALVATLCMTPAAHAGPDVVAGIGATTAIDGTPDNGGAALSLALLWPIEDHFHVGVMGFADDLGQQTTRLVAGGVDLGPVSSLHRQTAGVTWRLEGELPSKRWAPTVAVTWGLYRSTDDVRGARLGSATSAGVGAGLGLARRLSDRHSAGVMVRYQELSRGATHRYLTAAFEWRWRTGAGGRP
ncbi:MAG: hypothetical protein HY076_09175 [Candidatus Eisenbacteria bacterium]|uniref:Outer membrane protein beta-barrel domain-containing protein n=1 Tax=Eiseniibacteriota bacterium TaxID=2212470 RepID=A0A9D6QQ10_UNCEI|nr:hypothetical protein [Candidatus Eisenbacteria bacterium]MBI3540429.1 hypothetical protein [Candidatus Eisenbacteria bacterium]